MQDLRMGISYYLVKDRTRELYDLGKFTGNWAGLLAAPGLGFGPEQGCDFTVVEDVDLLTGLLTEDWRDAVADASEGYLRRVAEDVARWAGSDPVRFTSDASHDGWHNPDGSHDDGRVTGSRYSEDHPEWAAEAAS
jgi:hypothetical protein